MTPTDFALWRDLGQDDLRLEQLGEQLESPDQTMAGGRADLANAGVSMGCVVGPLGFEPRTNGL
jgi:hypothetical protein